jgi:RNA polymerase sigma-70 factor (ECF subfamily)
MALPEASERETQRIARGLREGDAALIGELVDRYQYRLVRFLIYLTGSSEQVEDLVQETWMRVITRARQYRGRSGFEAWLFSIARNLAVDGLRRKAAVGLDDSLAGGSSSPFLEAARGEDAERLAAAMQSLDWRYREVLVLRFQEDLSLLEIAGIVGAPVPTVSSRIQRGLDQLRAGWKGGANGA